MKPIRQKTYGSIPHLPGSFLTHGDHYAQPGQAAILTEKCRPGDTIIVTEKYDGSCVGVVRVQGELYPVTRKGHVASDSPFQQHHDFWRWFQRFKYLFEGLREGERLVGEWMVQKHATSYQIMTPEYPIVFFDYFGADNKRKPLDDLHTFLDEAGVGFLKASVLYRGKEALPVSYFVTSDACMYSDPRIRAIGPSEGLVYRAESADNGTDILAKWVRPYYEPGKYFTNDGTTPPYNIDPLPF